MLVLVLKSRFAGEARKYPYVALTAPSRFVLSQPLMERTSSWPHLVNLVVLASGPKPPLDALIAALDRVVNLVVLFAYKPVRWVQFYSKALCAACFARSIID